MTGIAFTLITLSLIVYTVDCQSPFKPYINQQPAFQPNLNHETSELSDDSDTKCTEKNCDCSQFLNPDMTPYEEILYELLISEGIFNKLFVEVYILPTEAQSVFYDESLHFSTALGVFEPVQQVEEIANLAYEAYQKKVQPHKLFKTLILAIDSYLQAQGELTNNFESMAYKHYGYLKQAYETVKNTTDGRTILFHTNSADIEFVKASGLLTHESALYILSKYAEELGCALKYA